MMPVSVWRDGVNFIRAEACAWFGFSLVSTELGWNTWSATGPTFWCCFKQWLSTKRWQESQKMVSSEANNILAYGANGPESSWAYTYLTCLHWSLCQFTPASMEVQPLRCKVFEIRMPKRIPDGMFGIEYVTHGESKWIAARTHDRMPYVDTVASCVRQNLISDLSEQTPARKYTNKKVKQNVFWAEWTTIWKQQQKKKEKRISPEASQPLRTGLCCVDGALRLDCSLELWHVGSGEQMTNTSNKTEASDAESWIHLNDFDAMVVVSIVLFIGIPASRPFMFYRHLISRPYLDKHMKRCPTHVAI